MNYEPFTSIVNLFIYVPIRHLYICRELSTNQLLLCKTNPILSAVGGLQMNVNIYNTMDYENKWQRRVRKNKPNSNPIKPNLQKAKMNVNSIITKDYRKKDDFAVRKNKAKTKPISVKPKMSANLYVIKEYERNDIFAVPENKANSNPISKQTPGGSPVIICLIWASQFDIILIMKMYSFEGGIDESMA